MHGVARGGKQGQEWMLPEDMETVYFKTFFGGLVVKEEVEQAEET